MKICVVADRDLKACMPLPKCDAVLFGFDALGDVDYSSELSGKTDKFEEVARLSKNANCTVLCGCKTDSRGIMRKSMVVAERGKLLGISDMMHLIDGENFKSGGVLGVYQAGGYKMGLCIENDLLFPESIKALSLCGCNLVAVVMEQVKDNIPPLLMRSYAYLYGVPVIMCGGKTAYFADISGEIACSTQKITVFETDPKNYYRIISTRQRGLLGDFASDY
jgi:hypothetical protein